MHTVKCQFSDFLPKRQLLLPTSRDFPFLYFSRHNLGVHMSVGVGIFALLF